MGRKVIEVRVGFDDEAGVCFILDSSLPGLNLEANSFEEMREKLPGAILDLIDCQDGRDTREVPVHIIGDARTIVSIPLAA